MKPEINPGELYVGRINNTHVILLPGDNDAATWKKQMAWAKKIGGDLPNKIELAMLFVFARDQFKRDWYWSNQTYVNSNGQEEAAYAWCQYFLYGNQYYSHKGINYCRARAVRRLEIGD